MKRLPVHHYHHSRAARGRSDDSALAYAALRDAAEWALDCAASIAAPYPEEAEAVENVRWFARASFAGLPVDVPADDVLRTLGILMSAIERQARRTRRDRRRGG